MCMWHAFFEYKVGHCAVEDYTVAVTKQKGWSIWFNTHKSQSVPVFKDEFGCHSCSYRLRTISRGFYSLLPLGDGLNRGIIQEQQYTCDRPSCDNIICMIQVSLGHDLNLFPKWFREHV